MPPEDLQWIWRDYFAGVNCNNHIYFGGDIVWRVDVQEKSKKEIVAFESNMVLILI